LLLRLCCRGGQLLQQQLAPQESSYQSSRAEALHNVEATIVELGSIFTQLAEMVAAQGEMTQRIDENVEETLGNVDNAKAQLMKYLNNISGNRWLLMKVSWRLGRCVRCVVMRLHVHVCACCYAWLAAGLGWACMCVLAVSGFDFACLSAWGERQLEVGGQLL
jgi:hypothetical protein